MQKYKKNIRWKQKLTEKYTNMSAVSTNLSIYHKKDKIYREWNKNNSQKNYHLTLLGEVELAMEAR